MNTHTEKKRKMEGGRPGLVQGAGADCTWEILFEGRSPLPYLALLKRASLSAGFFVQTLRCFGVPYPQAKQAQSFCVPRCLTGSLQLAIGSEQAGADCASCSPLERTTPERITTPSLSRSPSRAGAALLPAAIRLRSGVSLEANAISAKNPRQIALAKVFGIIGNSSSSVSTSLAC